MILEITNLQDLKGKTIADFKLSNGDLWLKFTDSTLAVLVVNDITEGFGYPRHEVSLRQYGISATDHELVELGIILEKEYLDACEQSELADQKRQSELHNRQQELVKSVELDQLSKLRAKYGV